MPDPVKVTFEVDEALAVALTRVVEELRSAREKHKPMNSPHEGWAVINEELDELWELVREKEHLYSPMNKEASQVATTALRFMVDVCWPHL